MKMAALQAIETELRGDLASLGRIQALIRNKLARYSDGKTLKGDEVVGWLGEIFVKTLYAGRMVEDSQEHDVETNDRLRIITRGKIPPC